LGPTAIGKTWLAIQLAQALDGEIVSADSRQVYRFMNIGTAKPTPEEQAQVPHHLIDFIDPADVLSLARYQEMAYAAIDDILARGLIPLLVGGTGQYITAVTEGWSIPEIPPNEELRAELATFAETRGVQALHDRLSQLDPDAAANIHPNNVRRVVRALEVYLESGERISELQRKMPPPYTIVELGLTTERQKLYDRADHRVDCMLQQGFLAEVRQLLDMGYNRKLPSLSGLGYRQLAMHVLDDVPLEEAIQITKNATHDFIRRQYTWFRGHDNGIVWHNVEDIDFEAFMTATIQRLNQY
jgi:tRNA dimethylallyltransferase